MPFCSKCRRADHNTRDHDWWVVERAVRAEEQENPHGEKVTSKKERRGRRD